MKNITKYNLGIILLFVVFLLSSCEFEEPWIEPQAGYEIQFLNEETNEIEVLSEPYTLVTGIKYDFISTGNGSQIVYWFGLPGDEKIKGSDFNDRGKNHHSNGIVSNNGVSTISYSSAGNYTVVQVASSYTYSDDRYSEVVVSKNITVVEP